MVSQTYRVDLAIEQQRDVVCKLFSLVYFIFQGAAPMPYVQVVILNLPHSCLRSTTMLLDNYFPGTYKSCLWYRDSYDVL